ncbi:MAG: cupin domain-containing protein [Chitinophagaceae bacterium]|jgi:mannose-6-phosphate isomerase-like protein (cupin superfamily)|nr:cupin domain-containing protein [Chitinophagaceae bacterium]MBK7679280.1 cupin domain-containing protein [Chitinophagaceae bacterium]MBK8299376.1 cupin domain-containing protein [Chitinophagaceae bacterium]MBK9463425.1 cupin domain-containing protein [Chitinophagaceae bacterium]MBK9659452.1 cupin domain-containing protein [Chitinophagaceae bacterium]
MRYSYPHTIDNGGGELITFLQLVSGAQGDWLEVENLVQPNSGPPMHVHFKQAESLTVVKGKIGIQHQGGEQQFFGEGETITFEAGDPHRFWNAGNAPLICRGWIKPAHNVEYFLTEIYKSTKANGGKQPSQFDGAWLMTRYQTEFDMTEIPAFVKKVIFPIVLFVGKLAGKHKKFADAPPPVK